VAQNAAIDVMRRRRFRMVSLTRSDDDGDGQEWELPSHEPSPEATLVGQQRDRQVQGVISRLPWEYRELILLRHYGELSYEEIAVTKGMPLGTVKNKLFRARQMLKGLLDGDPRAAD
jgi:RNA polymerase sigma-70 factor (ECF subfamily)